MSNYTDFIAGMLLTGMLDVATLYKPPMDTYLHTTPNAPPAIHDLVKILRHDIFPRAVLGYVGNISQICVEGMYPQFIPIPKDPRIGFILPTNFEHMRELTQVCDEILTNVMSDPHVYHATISSITKYDSSRDIVSINGMWYPELEQYDYVPTAPFEDSDKIGKPHQLADGRIVYVPGIPSEIVLLNFHFNNISIRHRKRPGPDRKIYPRVPIDPDGIDAPKKERIRDLCLV